MNDNVSQVRRFLSKDDSTFNQKQFATKSYGAKYERMKKQVVRFRSTK